MSDAASLIRPTVFLDTNALHYMSTYLLNARRHELPPYAGGPMDYDDVEAVLKEHLPKRIVECLMNGCKTLAYLESLSENESEAAEVYTSRLSKLEVLYGVLDGQAHAQMARAGGIPYRMRQRDSNLSELVSMYLETEDYETLAAELDNMFFELQCRTGIRISFAEQDKDIPTIIEFAELLQRHVFLDVVDCWMYGCAITVQADQILTYDRYFRKVVTCICDPKGRGGENWLRLQQAIRGELVRLSGVSTAIQLSLPKVPGIPRQVPRPW